MLLPLALIIPAVLAAAVVAYGTHPAWAQFPHGLDLVLWSYRLQWTLVTVSLLLCVALLGLVISGKRRAWWLIALMPVLTLFVHRYVNDPVNLLSVAENPTFVPASGAGRLLQNEDYVVGLRFGDDADAYAYPYAALYSTPVVVQDQHDKRLVLMWSAHANRAVATAVSREVRARDLEIVSVPANALLLYNGRIGQFVNALTGLTPAGDRPTGFGRRVATVKTTWKLWRDQNPQTRVMLPARPNGPRIPLRPIYPMPPAATPGKLPPDTRMTLVGATRPSAVRTNDLGAEPLNLRADDTPVLLFRDGAEGAARAFSRQLDVDTSPRFELAKKPKKPAARFIDRDTESGWDVNGAVVYGPPELKGKRLPPVAVEDDLYWGVMKFWYPQIELYDRPETMH